MEKLTADEVQFLANSSVILLLSLASIILSVKRERFLSAVNGLNIMILVFFAIGPICYYFTNIDQGRALENTTVIKYYAKVSGFFILGYLISFIIDYLTPVSKNAHRGLKESSPKTIAKAQVMLFTLALIGYLLSEQSFSRFGVGTFFPVLRKFLYPTIVLSIYNASSRRPVSLLLAGVICSVGYYFAFTSWWRSELLLISGAVAIGFLIRSRKAAIPLMLAGVLGILYILPFQQIKKIEYEKVKGNLMGTFVSTLNTSFEERSMFSAMFFAERINYGREMAHVQHALDKKWIELRGGETYQEIFLQLIPRVIWPDKPSFNTYVNIYVAKRIGLIGEENDHTAWGVNTYAEFILNFTYPWLVVFIPLLMLFFQRIDRLIPRLYDNPIIVFVTFTTFFFATFQMVSFIVMSTYIVWILLSAKMFELMLKMRYRRKSSILLVPNKPLMKQGGVIE